MHGQRSARLQIFILCCVCCFHELENLLSDIPMFFSFNNPAGMCSLCQGLGKIEAVDIERLLDKNKSLNEGAIRFPTFEPGGWRLTRYIYSGFFDNDKKNKRLFR